MMGLRNSKFKSNRVQDDDVEMGNVPRISSGSDDDDDDVMKGHKVSEETAKSFKAKVLSRVFSEDYEKGNRKIMDPRGQIISQWNKIFLVACLVSLFVDPLFLLLPTVIAPEICVENGRTFEVILTVIRSLCDVFYVIHIFVRFHTAYVAPSSRVFGRGELVIDPSKIALRYLRRGFCIDLIAAFPLPQVLTWVVIPNLEGTIVAVRKTSLWFIVMIQYLTRAFLIYPHSSKIVDANGVVTETAWAGAAYNLMLYFLASHVLGAWWYILSVQRQEACWRSACNFEQSATGCLNDYFDCRRVDDPLRVNWLQSTNVTNQCDPNASFYQYGIYANAVTTNVIGSAFLNKYFYSLWWGLQQLSSMAQNLTTTIYMGEVIFTIILATLGLVLWALFFGNMQRYLQSTALRLEEWRIKRNDTEQWMHHRQLPSKLRQSVREYDQYKWLATRGVHEEDLVNTLPTDLRREIKRHLCLSLVRQVPLFNQMDETILDVICERLKPALCTKSMFLVREGDPVNQMLFIIRGHLDSCTTDGGRSDFYNSCRIGPGDFCGEELLNWALDPRPHIILPSSTRTVKAITEVEAFALVAEDLKYVASQFRRLHSKQLRHTFRFYSHQWRTWAACFIQAAWRRHRKLKQMADHTPNQSAQESFWSMYADDLVKRTRIRLEGVSKSTRIDSNVVSSLQKPPEPYFD